VGGSKESVGPPAFLHLAAHVFQKIVTLPQL
jgi:hypothetical protein